MAFIKKQTIDVAVSRLMYLSNHHNPLLTVGSFGFMESGAILWRRHFHAEQTRPESRALPIVHHTKYECDLPPNHRFPMRKFSKVLEFLLRDNVVANHQVWAPEKASEKLLGLVHTQEYLTKFINGKTDDKEQRRTGFQWSTGIVSRCRYEVGGTLLAAELALDRGLASSTAGGTHHAFPSYGSGFCLLNDLAVSAHSIMGSSPQKRKILIVDLDVHQGDGTAFVFKDEPNVFTFSVHCQKNFPLRKENSDLDVGIEDGVEDQDYLATIQDHLPWLLDTFRPDLVLYDAGVDPHWEDELGRLRLTDEGLFQRDVYVIKSAIERGIPTATVIGGGYSRDIDKLGLRHSIVHRAATKVWREHGL